MNVDPDDDDLDDDDDDPTDPTGDDPAVIVETVSSNEPCQTCGGWGDITDEIICGDCAGTGTRVCF